MDLGKLKVASQESGALGPRYRDGADAFHLRSQYRDRLFAAFAMLGRDRRGQSTMIRPSFAHGPKHEQEGIRPLLHAIGGRGDIVDMALQNSQRQLASVCKITIQRGTADRGLDSDRIQGHGVSVLGEKPRGCGDNPLTPFLGIFAQ